MNLSRRSFLTALSLAGIPTSAGLSLLSQAEAAGTSSATASVPQVQLGEAKPFSREGLLSYVRELADKNYQAPSKVPQDWINLTYDQYRAINFRPGNGLWHDTVRPFEVEFFAPGLYFPSPVAVHTVEDGMSRPVLFDKNLFVMGDNVPNLSNGEGLGFAGLRVRANINAPDHKDEFLVFQGASYFRGVAKDQIYGLSARGLALKTGDAEGEEFPEFREFWVETPQAGDAQIRIHALMDSPSVAGLYTFDAKPGDSTDMSVSASLFPRVPLSHAGIAAQTSMFLFDDTNRNRFDDFREGVHDSDGLLVRNGAGETLWRPLGNPRELQISSFVDENPRGFGLMQRPRRFEDYSDLEANYHKRPSLWVEPGEDWGKGAVTLVEIPADKEIYDNIVAYWRPRKPLEPGEQHDFSYRLAWCDEAPIAGQLTKVVNTRIGKRVFEDGHIVAIDFAPDQRLPEDLTEIGIHVSSNGVKTSEGLLQMNPETGGLRLSFTFLPGERKSVELRAQLLVNSKPSSEVWLYRWTA